MALRVDSVAVGVYDGVRMSETWKNLRNSFFAGLLVVVPVAASVLILLGIFTWVTDFMLPDSLRQQMLTPLYRIIALILFVAFTIGVGWVTHLVAGKRMVSAAESLITQVPLLNKTYGFMKEISQTVLSGKKTMFQRVVLVEFPRAGMHTIGFVTNETGGETRGKMREAVISVFVPAAPNPTSGVLLFIRWRGVDGLGNERGGRHEDGDLLRLGRATAHAEGAADPRLPRCGNGAWTPNAPKGSFYADNGDGIQPPRYLVHARIRQTEDIGEGRSSTEGPVPGEDRLVLPG